VSTPPADAPAPDVSVRLAEYERAQGMLQHYDALNWQIGAIFISANAILLGLVATKDFLQLFEGQLGLGILTAGLLASFSGVLLIAWWLWFRRHRDLYNFRNETLHRIEQELGMYHFLRVVEAERGLTPQLETARARAGHGIFPAFYAPTLHSPSGYRLARGLAFTIPVLEFAILSALIVAVNR
jgi:hypothetical protein